METKIFTSQTMAEAGQLIREGELIAFPTETVYGLGALASNDEAVKKVYQVKGRPSDNPLIVHVASKEIAQYVKSVPEIALQLMDTFWPGPLTLIFEAKEGIFAPSVNPNMTTVSLRMPKQALALQFIEEIGFPIVGPSANKSGKPSPTAVSHVQNDMQGRIAGIIDGGTTEVGVESTVLDLTDERGPIILRPGSITREILQETLNMKVWLNHELAKLDEDDIPKAPGMKYVHYSPTQPVILVDGAMKDWKTLIKNLKQEGKTIGVLASDETLKQLNDLTDAQFSLGDKGKPEEASKALYAGLRYFDEKSEDVAIILAEAYPKAGIGDALMNRMEKAASSIYPE